MREVCKGGQCVAAKRRLWLLKPNRPGLTSWLHCLLAMGRRERYLSSQSLGYLLRAMGHWYQRLLWGWNDIKELKHWAQRWNMAGIQQRYVGKVEDDSYSFCVAMARTKWLIIREVGLGLQWPGRSKDWWQLGDSSTLQRKSHWERSQKRDPGKEFRLRVVGRGFQVGSPAREELLRKTVQFNADV